MKSTIEPVQVYLRCLPVPQKDLDKGNKSIVSVDHETNQITVGEYQGSKPKSFIFDNLYGEDTENETVFEQCAAPIIQDVLEGYNGTIINQKNIGDPTYFNVSSSISEKSHNYIVLSTLEHIFNHIEQSDRKHLVKISAVRLFNGEIYN